MTLNLLFNVLVLLLNHINVTVEHVDVVIKRIVLLFSLHESRYNFFDTRNTSLFLDLFKSILNDLHVSNVHVHKVLLFKVVCLPARKTGLEESSRVWELSGLELLRLVFGRSFASAAETTFLFGVVAFTELGLEGLNFFLKVDFVGLVLLLQSENLVVCLFADALALVTRIVKLFHVFDGRANLAAETLVDTRLVALLLAPDINFLAELFIARAQVIVASKGFVETVFHLLDFVVVLAHFAGSGAFTESLTASA